MASNNRTRPELAYQGQETAGEVPREPKREVRAADRAQLRPPGRGFHEAIVSLYAKGLTTGEFRAHLGEIYGVEVARDLVSRVSEEPAAWQPAAGPRLPGAADRGDLREDPRRRRGEPAGPRRLGHQLPRRAGRAGPVGGTGGEGAKLRGRGNGSRGGPAPRSWGGRVRCVDRVSRPSSCVVTVEDLTCHGPADLPRSGRRRGPPVTAPAPPHRSWARSIPTR